MKRFRFVSVLVLMGALCIGALFCAKKKNPAKWENPQDQTGANWHPPTVQVMEGGAVPFRDSLYITAVASDSNGTILDYCWEINGNGFNDTTIAGTLDVLFPDTGLYKIRVKARDNDKLFSLPDSALFYATFYPPQVLGMPDFAVSIYDTFTLTAAGTDSNGTIRKYLWALDGVNFMEETVAGSLVTVFDSEGLKSVKVRAMDNDNLLSLPDEIRVTVRLDAPTVTLMNDFTVSIYDTFSITATASDPNGVVQGYYWAFDGINFIDSTDTGFVQHVFDSAGVYDVKVKVKDNDGVFSIDDVVRITVSLNGPTLSVMDDFETSVFDTVLLTASAIDINGIITRYVWALDGLQYTDSTASGSLKTSFTSQGLKTIRVVAYDDDGIMSSVGEIIVTVALNAPSVTVMHDTILSVGVPETLRAMGADVNGRIKKYCWALDGGIFADSTDDGFLNVMFSEEQELNVKVKVIDDDGIESSVEQIRCAIRYPAPDIVSPSGSHEIPWVYSLRMAWIPGSYNDRFRLTVIDIDSSMSVVIDTVLTDTAYNAINLIKCGKQYGITLIGIDPQGSTSESETCNFTVSDTVFSDNRDGRLYRMRSIGAQRWMVENIKIGSFLHGNIEQTENGKIETYAYNNDAANVDSLGGLYQWEEAMAYGSLADHQGICPNGWHIPSDEEWKTLEIHLGMSSATADQTGFRGSFEGNTLKGGTFNAVLTGYRLDNGSFGYIGTHTGFWSSSQANTLNAWYRYLAKDYPTVYRNSYTKKIGYCVRCIRD